MLINFQKYFPLCKKKYSVVKLSRNSATYKQNCVAKFIFRIDHRIQFNFCTRNMINNTINLSKARCCFEITLHFCSETVIVVLVTECQPFLVNYDAVTFCNVEDCKNRL